MCQDVFSVSGLSPPLIPTVLLVLLMYSNRTCTAWRHDNLTKLCTIITQPMLTFRKFLHANVTSGCSETLSASNDGNLNQCLQDPPYVVGVCFFFDIILPFLFSFSLPTILFHAQLCAIVLWTESLRPSSATARSSIHLLW